jgi:hypothetical protein
MKGIREINHLAAELARRFTVLLVRESILAPTQHGNPFPRNEHGIGIL